MKSPAAMVLAVMLAGCGGGTSGPEPGNNSPTAESAVRNFMQAVDDSNITRMSQLWGTANGPAAETKKPDDYERRMIITQVYLRKSPFKVVREDPVTDDPKKRVVMVELDRGNCTKSVPFTVVNTGKTWLVNQVDLNLAGTPTRPCDSNSAHE